MPRDAMQARHAFMRCVCHCVCLSVTFVNSVKRNKHIFNFFPSSRSHTMLVFHTRRRAFLISGFDYELLIISESDLVHRCCPSVCLSVCLLVCLSVGKMHLANLMSWSQSYLWHCRVLLPLGEFAVMIPEPHATLHGAVTWRNQCHDRATFSPH